jgi:NodT family efflux transporter outer membrane factor (OMF) lipoprotein
VKFRAWLLAPLAAALSLLPGCTVGPDYARPSVETPAAYKEAGAWKVAEPRDDASRGKWWEIFGDPQLNALAGKIDISNQNLRLAEAQFREAQALVQSARAGLFPTVDGSASITRSRSPTGAIGGTTAGRVVTSRSLGVNASWEADLWGRLGRTVEASEASAQASAADLEAARLSAQAALVQDYMQLRALDAQQRLLEDTVAAFEKSLELTKNRYAVGVAGKVDVVQAETQLKSTQAQAIDIGVQRAQLEHAIALLVGTPPSEFSIERVPFRIAVPSIPFGVPSELLERRPDIAAAERRVAAAQIGVAQAAFFPSLTLSASGGFRSADAAQWLTAPSRFWSFGPAIAQTIFDAGRRRALTDQAIAAYDATVATYRQTVLTGFQEVEDNLAALRILEQEAKVQDEAVQAGRQSLTLTTNQYKAGTISYLNVVVVQAAQLNNERTAVGILGQRLAAAVLLVKALGGGWHAPGPGATATPQP